MNNQKTHTDIQPTARTEDGDFGKIEEKSCSDIESKVSTQPMGPLEMQDWLATAIELGCEDNGEHPAEVNSFSDAGLLTQNCGLVVRMTDGTEFQITIVKTN